MGMFDFLFKGDIQKEAAPRISGGQQELLDSITSWLKPQVGKGAQPYPGQLPGTAAVPELFTKAYEQYASQIGRGDVTSAMRDLISGKPAYTFDPAATTKAWQQTYATPMMQTWEQTVMPMVESQYNIPGGFYSTRKGLGVGRAASEFYGGQVAPTLFGALQAGEQRGFESTEAAAGRRPGALGLPFEQFTQAAQAAGAKMGLDEKQLTAAFNEFLRTRAEPGWAVQTGGQLAGMPTMDWAAFREPSIFEQAAGPATAAMMMAGG